MQAHQPRGFYVNGKEYQELASRTESTDFDTIGNRLRTVRAIRLFHAQLGIASEGGEIADQLKKHIFYGKSLDTVNLAEEVGDLFWYLALLANELGVDFESIMETNIAKLKKRYGDKFSEQRATQRNLDIERQILEGSMRPATEADDWETILCDRCGAPADAVPYACLLCGADLGKSGGVVKVIEIAG